MPDRFANGDRANDTGGIPGGPEDHGFDPTRIGYFHGGDFPGLTGKLDYLQGLHVTTLWTTPPFRNNPVQRGSAGYHGYWITDFENIDPHFGTNADYREFVRQAHTRGMRVYLDIVVNHTGDIIQYEGGKYDYIDAKTSPTRNAAGEPFDERAAAYNGLNDPAAFPRLSADRSFPYRPVLPAALARVKNPAWLNDVTLYHNRGNSLFAGESATRGDFVGLDDLMTEHPRVVRGFIDVFGRWLEAGVDGFRIDTMRHVNAAFWQAFNPALRAKARALGRPDFLQFGEVMNGNGDVGYLAEFSTGTMAADTTTDFPFAGAVRAYASQGGPATALSTFFLQDDRYTDHDSNIHASVTLLGNYDIARWGYFLQQDNPGASREQLADLVRLGHGLLYLARGMPVLHYGDEQGMVGRGGDDMQAREDMFASQAPDYRDAPLLGTTRTGADDKFDPTHPFYRFFAALGRLRQQHGALRTGAMILRPTVDPTVFAFSRIERNERVEYIAVFNNSRVNPVTSTVPTSQPEGSRFSPVFDSTAPDQPASPALTAGAGGNVAVTLAPLQFAVWRAERPLAALATGPAISLVAPLAGATLKFTSREFDDLILPSRRELRAEVTGGDGVAEVSFFLTRASRPNQFEFLGTDEAAPYRIYWTPPADLAPDEKLTFIATVNDLRGHTATARVTDIQVTGKVAFGIAGALNPTFTAQPPAEVSVPFGGELRLTAAASGSGDLEYQWYQDGEPIRGANATTYVVPAAGTAHNGTYRLAVHNLAGTTLTAGTKVTVGSARIVRRPAFPSRFVAPRTVDVWLPPGYDANPAARYPVIYLHDGQNLFDGRYSFGGQSWKMDAAMQRLIDRGASKGAILVGLWNNGLSRFAEYLPQKALPPGLAAIPLGVAGQKIPAAMAVSDAYLRFIVEELKPFIDRTYRTQPDPAHTAIMGSSMGGLISAYALAEYPEVFGAAACVSTHWPAGEGCVADYLATHLPKAGSHRLYFDFGTETLDASYEPFQQRMDAGLRALGYTAGRDWVTRKFPGADHSEKSWSERADQPLAFLFEGKP
jgi:glycosidase/predicted alpha/beta superfamily hydrolase